MMATISLAQLCPLLGATAAFVSPGCEDGGAEPAPAAASVRPDGPATVEFGQVHEGSLLTHRFELETLRPVAIRDVKTDCGCTLARLERETPSGPAPYEVGTPLDSGEKLHLEARYDTRGRRGPARRAVTLTTDAGEVLPLTLSADVQPWLLTEPDELDYVRLLEGQTAERTLRVRSVTGEPFLIRATGKGLPAAVTVEVRPEGPDDSGRAPLWTARVALGPDTPRGTHAYPIELESDVVVPGSDALGEPRHFSVAPAWTLQIVGPVALSRPTLEFGLVRPEETVARSVRLESFDPAFTLGAPAARLEPLRPDEPFPLGRTASVRARAVPGTSAFDVELTLAGLDPGVSGTFLGRLVVETGHPGLPRLEALVRGVRAPAGVPSR